MTLLSSLMRDGTGFDDTDQCFFPGYRVAEKAGKCKRISVVYASNVHIGEISNHECI
jgi:hypothetical protein